MTAALRDLYFTVYQFVRTFGALQLFFLRLLMYSPGILVKRFGLVIKQVYNAGALSLVIIMVCGLFVGGVLGLQGFSNLARFNAEDSVGAVAALALVKELGPVITALLFAGRAGTALASEIGLMKATDQLSAMEMMAVNPIRRVVVPRFLGGVFSMRSVWLACSAHISWVSSCSASMSVRSGNSCSSRWSSLMFRKALSRASSSALRPV
jgi:phospholipid/cholesterol/gamma-HCH transport system permease protein